MSTNGGLPLATVHRVRDSCLCLHVRRAARALARRYDDALRPVGLTNGQFSLMMSLNRPAPPRMGDVSTLLAMDRTTLTANLKPLERHGWVRTLQDPEDRRIRRLELTPAGRALLAEALPLWEAAQEDMAEHLPEGDLSQVLATLRALS